MVKITKLPNGILFETTGLPGSGEKFAIKKFVPKNFANILDVQLYSECVIATDVTGFTYMLNLDGSDAAYPVSQIDQDNISNIPDLFDKFIAVL